MPGPIPMREDQLQKPRDKPRPDTTVRKGLMREVAIPVPGASWNGVARMVWDSLELSGQSDFFQQSDWAFAYLLCDNISDYQTASYANGDKKRSPEMFKALLSGMERLLLTEGDRRRLKVELSLPVPDEHFADLHYIGGLADELDGDVEDDPEDDEPDE